MQDLIPKHKTDLETAHKLTNYSYDEVREIIPQLLEWIQDGNWPVAKPVGDYLLSISQHITNDIIKILNGNDDIWKYWCIHLFGFSNQSINPELLNEFRRIANSPTRGEIDEEVNVLAKELIDKVDGIKNSISVNSTGQFYNVTIRENAEWEDFHHIADELKRKLSCDFVEKIEDFDSRYWDFTFNDKTFTLHYNVMVGEVEILTVIKTGLSEFQMLLDEIEV